jgi:hypothetical protein
VRFQQVIHMKISKILLPCFLVLAAALPAQADWGTLGMAGLFGYGGFNFAGTPTFNNYTPPYFALHPPVYYGQRFTRPYGVSPYAAWPQLQSNPEYAPQPHVDRSMIICNPYVMGAEVVTAPELAAKELPAKQFAGPLVIDNPYYKPQAVIYTNK